MELSTSTILTQDGVRLTYDRVISNNVEGNNAVVLIHGWSGSRHYFDTSIKLIAEACKAPVYAIDLRGHGDSDKPDWGYHVARLAADLRDFLAALSLTRVVLVGSSMGAAVIWSFVELFGQDNIKGCVFIDQAPLQYRADDWQLGSNGCYDATTLKQLQQAVRSDFLAFAKGNADACLAQRLSPELEEYLVQETLKASQDALCQLMADHTQLDWRPILRRIRRPCLNLVGRKSKIFPWQGVAAVGDMVLDGLCTNVFFEDCDHWLYLEDPTRFANEVASFASRAFVS